MEEKPIMMSLCKTLKDLNKDELDTLQEECIINKSDLQEEKANILLELNEEEVMEDKKRF